MKTMKTKESSAEKQESKQKKEEVLLRSITSKFMNISVEKISIDKSYRFYTSTPPYEKWTKEFIEEKEKRKLYRTLKSCRILQKNKIKTGVGIPDYCYEDNKKAVFVECKTSRHGVTLSQLKWMQENTEYHTRIIFVEVILKKRWPDGTEDKYIH